MAAAPRRGGHEAAQTQAVPPRDTPFGAATSAPGSGAAKGARGWLSSSASAAASLLLAPIDALARRRAARAWDSATQLVLVDTLAAVRDACPELQLVCPRIKASSVRVDADGVFRYRSLDGAISGDMRSFAGGPVAHAVTSQLWNARLSVGSAHINVYLDAAACPAPPHLVVEVSVVRGKLLFYVDLLPRIDLKISDNYLQQMYLETPPGCARSPAELVRALLNDGTALTPHISRDAVTRVFLASPAAALFWAPNTPDGLARVRAAVVEMTAAWVALLHRYGQPMTARSNLALELPDAAALAQRDRVARNACRRDPDAINVARLVGTDTMAALFQIQSGYADD